MIYIGHAAVMNDQIQMIGEDGEVTANSPESFLRSISSSFPNVYAGAFFDCCRMARGYGGNYTSVDECNNIMIIYREKQIRFRARDCGCEPWDRPKSVKDFFAHVKAKREARNPQVTVFPSDCTSAFPLIKHCVRNWNDLPKPLRMERNWYTSPTPPN